MLLARRITLECRPENRPAILAAMISFDECFFAGKAGLSVPHSSIRVKNPQLKPVLPDRRVLEYLITKQ